MARYGMVIDLSYCTGCYTCMIACKMANLTEPGMNWIKVVQLEWKDSKGNVGLTLIPLQCMHCDNPPCVLACPVGATYKDEKGVVHVDPSKCIGCGVCIQACPYDARTLAKGETYGEKYFGKTLPYEVAGVKEGGFRVHKPFVAEKCTFCMDNPETTKLGPACVRCCPTGARTFGDLDDPESSVSKLVKEGKAQPLFPELGTQPKVFYVGLPPKEVLAQLPIKARFVVPPPKVERVTERVTVRERETITTTVPGPTVTATVTTTVPGPTVTEVKTLTETMTETKTVASPAATAGAAVAGLLVGSVAAYFLARRAGKSKASEEQRSSEE